MIDYSSRNFKKIVEKIQSEANGISSLIAENEFVLFKVVSLPISNLQLCSI